MKRYVAVIFLVLFALHPARAEVTVGAKAPEFALPGADGRVHHLSDYAGNTVILEWNNPDCPFVKKFYESGEMQRLQKEIGGKEGVVWLTINSSAEGRQGFLTQEQAKEAAALKGIVADAYLLDHNGSVGKLYNARTTPHMFVIDKEGNLAYQGAIDSEPSANPADIQDAQNYVVAAINALEAGEPVKHAVTQPYGCSVKYAQ